MHSRQFHFPSIAVGILGTALVLVSMSQAVPLLSPPRIQYGPNPNDMITIKEGTPYTVPQGRVLVLTGLGSTYNAVGCLLSVDGAVELWQYNNANGNNVSIGSIPTGMTVNAGSTVTVASQATLGQGRALGYLSAR